MRYQKYCIRMQSKKKIDVSCQIITAVSEDTEMAAQRAKTTLAFYVEIFLQIMDLLKKLVNILHVGKYGCSKIVPCQNDADAPNARSNKRIKHEF